MNFPAILVAALIPLIMGAIWYNPKVFGNAWMKASGMTEEKIRMGNMAVIFGLTYLFSIMAGTILNYLVIHQGHMYSILVNEPGFGDANSEVGQYLAAFMEQYGDNFRTFKHGAFHGAITGIFFALPVIGILGLFERKGWRYILLHAGYWTLSFTLMGGLICAWK